MGHWANMGNKTHVYEMNMKHIKHTQNKIHKKHYQIYMKCIQS